MARILIIGAGISGCGAANVLAVRGFEVILVEKSPQIGGKARTYGCKAVEKCQNCGVCLTTGLWDKVLKHDNVEVLTDSVVSDIRGSKGSYAVTVATQRESGEQAEKIIENIDSIIVSTGFENQTNLFSAHLHIEGIGESLSPNIITGTQLEQLMLNRTRTSLFEDAPHLKQEPRNIAFIQCLGSRDKNEGGLYCSRVCCSYATRAAKLIRSYYPECDITFFYMELQNVESGDFYAGLKELDVKFVKCRPLDVGDDFDLVVLSDGIHAGIENNRIAEIFRLTQDRDGFLRTVDEDSDIYVCGTARGPMKIEEAYADAVAVAGRIIEVESGKMKVES